MPDERKENELVLPVGTYATILNTNNGILTTVCGPQKITIQNTDQPVVYDKATSSQYRYVSATESRKTNMIVPKGSYAILRNPVVEGSPSQFPPAGRQTELQPSQLDIGKVVNLPGPLTFALWPSQEVSIVSGHHLKTDEYLVVRVYDEEAARSTWNTTASKAVDGSTDSENFLGLDPQTLVIGKLVLIKGNVVSFYMPPTGVEVVKDGDSYVRQALTLERLEFCLLANQDGTKRYVKGPDVVFPEPTETFKLNDDGQKKSRAYELNQITGLHIKVISDYKDEVPVELTPDQVSEYEKAGLHVLSEDNKQYVWNVEGEELFITGKVMAIYYPRIEHAILTYGDKRRSRYHAVAVPAGEARYVMNRLTGEIRNVRGYTMLLPDPRTEVIVQRVLSDNECKRYYPGNQEVLSYNRMLRNNGSDPETASFQGLSNTDPVPRPLLPSDPESPEYRTGHASLSMRGAESEEERGISYGTMKGGDLQREVRKALAAGKSSTPPPIPGNRPTDVIDRGTKFTPPRTLILDPRFEGAPKVSPWTGYAIQIVDAEGKRTVIVGPQTVNLKFDERLEVLYLSTGTPKQHDNLLETSYLKITNNVTDEFQLVTSDLVPIKIRLKYLIRFEEQHRSKWFSVDNYVQLLVDHFRSLVMNLARAVDVQTLYTNSTTKLREWILGEEGFTFAENGMTVYDLNVMSVNILDGDVASVMKQATQDALKAKFTKESETIARDLVLFRELTAREKADASWETAKRKLEIERLTVETTHEKSQKEAELELQRLNFRRGKEKEIADLELLIAGIQSQCDVAEWEIDKQKAIHTATLNAENLMKEAEAMEKRTKAIQPELVAALVALAESGAFEVAARHLGNLAILKDMSLGGVVKEVFRGTQFEGVLENIGKMGKGKLLGSGS